MSNERIFEIGGNQVTAEDVCSVLPPSDLEFARTSRLLGCQISSGVPILEAIAAVGSSVKHPWLVMTFAASLQKVRQGEGFAVGLENALKEFTAEVPNAPNLMLYFSSFAHLADIGEECGTLDQVLHSFAELCENTARSGKLLSSSADLRSLLLSFATFMDVGAPVLRTLRALQAEPRLYMFRDELSAISDEIEQGCSLSEACTKANGVLADRVIANVIRAGEAGGNLEVVLRHLTL